MSIIIPLKQSSLLVKKSTRKRCWSIKHDIKILRDSEYDHNSWRNFITAICIHTTVRLKFINNLSFPMYHKFRSFSTWTSVLKRHNLLTFALQCLCEWDVVVIIFSLMHFRNLHNIILMSVLELWFTVILNQHYICRQMAYSHDFKTTGHKYPSGVILIFI